MKYLNKINLVKQALASKGYHFASHGGGYCYLTDDNYAYGRGAMSYPIKVGAALQLGIHPIDMKRLGLAGKGI